jgi:hypothetical protein
MKYLSGLAKNCNLSKLSSQVVKIIGVIMSTQLRVLFDKQVHEFDSKLFTQD